MLPRVQACYAYTSQELLAQGDCIATGRCYATHNITLRNGNMRPLANVNVYGNYMLHQIHPDTIDK